MPVKAIILLFFPLLLAQNVFSQQKIIERKRFPVRSLNYENGLIDNSTSSIVTDIYGYTWVAAFTGLQRFNGYRLQTINPVAGKDTFFIDYPVMLFGLENNHILITVKEGILEYDPYSDKFILRISLLAAPFFHFGLLPLKETKEGIWYLHQTKGIVLYDKAGKLKQAFSFFSHDIIKGILQSDYLFYSEPIASNNNFIYVKYLNKDILCINIIEKTNTVISFKEPILALGCLHDQLFVAEKNKLIIINDFGFGKQTKIDLDTTENITGCSFKMADNDHLFFSRNEHLYVLNSSGNIDYEFTDRDKKSFIKNGSIQKIYLDSFNRIWILSNNDIKRIENAELVFQNYSYPDKQNNFIRALYFDSLTHILYAGGYNGMIQAFDTSGNALWVAPVITKVGQYLTNIEKLAKNKYLVTSSNNDFFIFNAALKKVFALKAAHKVNGLQNAQTNYPNNLQRINDSIILIATNNNVLKCHFQADLLVSVIPLFPDTLNRRMNSFIYTRNKMLWAGTNNGFLFVMKDSKLFRLEIPGNYVIRSMAENELHQICVGTEKGLFVYDENFKLLKKTDISSGLRNDCIYAIAVSGEDLYVSTNLGLSYIGANGLIQNFSKEMGLQDNEFNTNAVLQLKSGKIFFGGINGITSFYPLNLSRKNYLQQIQVAQLTVNDVSLNSSSGIWLGDTIQLNYKQNHLHFDIVALGFFNADEYIYQYRMKGFDTSWESANNLSGLNYTLQPGSYTLEIKSYPTLSPDSVSSKNILIIITPPWWQTWWFTAVMIFVLVASIYLIIYRYNRKLYLDKIRAFETQQEIQNERERISRELHDNIGAQLSFIISNIDWTIESAAYLTKEEERQRLSSINNTARNVMGNLRESIWALNKEKITLEEFADKLKQYILNIIEIKPGLEFFSEENFKGEVSFSPTETLNVFRICQEVINNVIKHASATTLKVIIKSDSKAAFSICIEDNGKGFNMIDSKEGYGLENIKYRAKEMKLILDIQSSPGKGTKVLLHK